MLCSIILTRQLNDPTAVRMYGPLEVRVNDTEGIVGHPQTQLSDFDLRRTDYT